LGIDRTVLAAAEQGVAAPPPQPLVAVVSAVPDDFAVRLRVAGTLREANLNVRTDGSQRRLGRQLEGAAKAGARWAVILSGAGSDGPVTVRDLESGDQQEVSVADVAQTMRGSG
jgi:histidyl-tRNA synthetase